MVRVHHVYRFVSQKVFSPSCAPTSALASTADGVVLVATEDRRIQAFIIHEDRVDPLGGFPTVARVSQLLVSDLFDFVATLEEKNFQTFVRIYFEWRDVAAFHENAGVVRMRVRLALVDHSLRGASVLDTPPTSPNADGRLDVVEIPLRDHASSVAVCPVQGDVGVAVNRSIIVYQVVSSSNSAPDVALKFVLNLDKVAAEVALCAPFLGVVYATVPEIKVFRIDHVENIINVDYSESELISTKDDFSLKPTLCLYKTFSNPKLDQANIEDQLRLAFFKNDRDVFCLVSGLKEGLLYALSIKDNGIQRCRLLGTYPFTSPPLGFSTDGVVLQALTDNGLESYPCRSFSGRLIAVCQGDCKKTTSLTPAQAKILFPPEDVSLLGLTSFIGASAVTFSQGHVIILTKSEGRDDSCWALYALEQPSMSDLETDMSSLAVRYENVSRPIHADLVREIAYMLQAAHIRETGKKVTEDVEGLALLKVFDLEVTECCDEAAVDAVSSLLRNYMTFDNLLKYCQTLMGKTKNGSVLDFLGNFVIRNCHTKFLQETAEEIKNIIIRCYYITDSIQALSRLLCEQHLSINLLDSKTRHKILLAEDPHSILISCALNDHQINGVEEEALLKLIKDELDIILCNHNSSFTEIGHCLCHTHQSFFVTVLKTLAKENVLTWTEILTAIDKLQDNTGLLEAMYQNLTQKDIHSTETLQTNLNEETAAFRLTLIKVYLLKLAKGEKCTKPLDDVPCERRSWLNMLPPFNGLNPNFVNCMQTWQHLGEPRLCPCANCNQVLINTQHLLTEASQNKDELATDFEKGLIILTTNHAKVFAENVMVMCGQDLDRWRISIKLIMSLDYDSENLKAKVLKMAAESLVKNDFLEVIPGNGNLPYFAPYLKLCQNLTRIRDYLKNVAKTSED